MALVDLIYNEFGNEVARYNKEYINSNKATWKVRRM